MLQVASDSLVKLTLRPFRLLHHRVAALHPRTGVPLRALCKVKTMAIGGSYDRELKEACKAVRLASQLCRKVQQQLKDDESVSKDDASPVTVADYGAQALVAWSLQNSFGANGFSMVAEEASNDLREPSGAKMAARIADLVNETLAEGQLEAKLDSSDILNLIDSGRSEGGSQGRHWVLDPIDGTRGFVGQRQYAICLGLLDAGEAVVGVLGCPNLPQTALVDADGEAGAASRSSEGGVGCLFAAQKGHGAFVGPLRGDEAAGQALQLSDLADVSEARFMESYESAHSDQSFTSRLARKLGVTKAPLRLDSQTKYGALARGDALINLRFPHAGYREKIWDHVAGVVIVIEAGAVVSDASGNALDFGKGRWLDLDRGIVTSTPTVHAALIKAILQITEEDASKTSS